MSTANETFVNLGSRKQKRGVSEQAVAGAALRQRQEYERALYGMDRSLQDHMLGVGRRPARGSLNPKRRNFPIGAVGASLNSFMTTDPGRDQHLANQHVLDSMAGATRFSLPKINLAAQHRNLGHAYAMDASALAGAGDAGKYSLT